jgi:hypothetical protein
VVAVKATAAKAPTVEKVEEVDAVWAKLQSENHVPPLEFNGLSLPEPTKRQIDAWRAAKDAEEGERALWGDQYDAVHELFDDAPVHIWENFNVLYLRHMFGTDGEDLKG